MLSYIIILLFVAFTLTSPAFAQSVHDPEPPNAEQSDTGDKPAPQQGSSEEATTDVGASEKFNTGNADDSAQENKKKVKKATLQDKDHKAQLWMNRAAWAQVLLTLGGLLLIWRTLAHTKKATTAAKNAADAAWGSVSETKDSSRKQLRAYVGIEKIESEKKLVPQGIGRPTKLQRPDDNPMTILVTFKNAGQSPANNVIIKINMLSARGENPVHLPEPQRELSVGSLMPHTAHHLDSEFVTDNWLDVQSSILDGTAAIIVYGTITYNDLYGSAHKTAFNAKLTREIDGARFEINSAEKNYMT